MPLSELPKVFVAAVADRQGEKVAIRPFKFENRRFVVGPHALEFVHAPSLRGCVLFGECAQNVDRHHRTVAYLSDLTDAQWKILEPLLLVPSKRGPKHGDDLRHVVNAMLYISHTGCQWRYLPEQFGPWTLDEGLVPVSPMVEERDVDARAVGAARLVAQIARTKGMVAFDGGY